MPSQNHINKLNQKCNSFKKSGQKGSYPKRKLCVQPNARVNTHATPPVIAIRTPFFFRRGAYKGSITFRNWGASFWWHDMSTSKFKCSLVLPQRFACLPHNAAHVEIRKGVVVVVQCGRWCSGRQWVDGLAWRRQRVLERTFLPLAFYL